MELSLIHSTITREPKEICVFFFEVRSARREAVVLRARCFQCFFLILFLTFQKNKTPLHLNQKDVYEKIVRLTEASGGFRTS